MSDLRESHSVERRCHVRPFYLSNGAGALSGRMSIFQCVRTIVVERN
jgi:hypothetical protein